MTPEDDADSGVCDPDIPLLDSVGWAIRDERVIGEDEISEATQIGRADGPLQAVELLDSISRDGAVAILMRRIVNAGKP